MIFSWSGRTYNHVGTEKGPISVEEAAVGNIGQWAKA